MVHKQYSNKQDSFMKVDDVFLFVKQLSNGTNVIPGKFLTNRKILVIKLLLVS